MREIYRERERHAWEMATKFTDEATERDLGELGKGVRVGTLVHDPDLATLRLDLEATATAGHHLDLDHELRVAVQLLQRVGHAGRRVYDEPDDRDVLEARRDAVA